MPMYNYECSDGHFDSRFYPSDKIAKRPGCKKCNRKMRRNYGANTRSPGAWPQYSDAMGVEPSAVAWATKEATESGCPTDFLPDGRAVFTSPRHRKEFCELRMVFDRDGCYGDPQKGATQHE